MFCFIKDFIIKSSGDQIHFRDQYIGPPRNQLNDPLSPKILIDIPWEFLICELEIEKRVLVCPLACLSPVFQNQHILEYRFNKFFDLFSAFGECCVIQSPIVTRNDQFVSRANSFSTNLIGGFSHLGRESVWAAVFSGPKEGTNDRHSCKLKLYVQDTGGQLLLRLKS